MITENYTTICLRREFRTPVAQLYKAWTEPKIFRAWWKNLVVVEMDARIGGGYLLKWSQDDKDYARGEFKELTPFDRIVMSWETSDVAGGKVLTPVADSRLTLNFKSTGPNSSTLELIHEFLPKDRVDGHHYGWTYALVYLDEHFNAGARKIDPSLAARVTKTLPFPIDRVYGAWTDSKAINMWFNRSGHTLGHASADVRVGGKYSMDFHKKTGEVVRLYGEYKEVVSSKRLSFTWVDDNHEEGHVTFHRQYPSLVSVDFKDLGARGTEVAIVHSELTSEIEMKDYENGWTGCLRSQEEELAK